jgi:uncharacterized protein (DUF4415 family)
MKSRVITRKFDPTKPPRLTPKLKAELEALEAMPDSEIDYSDIPPLDEKFWKNAVRNPYLRAVKQQLTLRLDADLIAWFKRQAPNGRGYQSAINAALREHVERQHRDSPKAAAE